MSNQRIVTQQGYMLLKSMVGKTIRYAYAPKLIISSQVIVPAHVSTKREGERFFESLSISLKLKSSEEDDGFTIILPGLDADIPDWTPLSISHNAFPNVPKSIESCNYDSAICAEGYSRINCFPSSKIIKISLLKFGLYAGIIFSHECGLDWCCYAEYDFQFWFCFDQVMIRDLISASERQQILT